MFELHRVVDVSAWIEMHRVETLDESTPVLCLSRLQLVPACSWF